MKIHLRGKAKPFTQVKVTCLDSRMVEMVSCAPDSAVTLTAKQVEAFRRGMRSRMAFYTFLGGSVLTFGDATNEWFISCMQPGGSDVVSAVHELKMLDALRLAKKHFLASKAASNNPSTEDLTLRVTRY